MIYLGVMQNGALAGHGFKQPQNGVTMDASQPLTTPDGHSLNEHPDDLDGLIRAYPRVMGEKKYFVLRGA